MNNKNVLIWCGVALIVVLALAGALYFAADPTPDDKSPLLPIEELAVPVGIDEISQGSSVAPVILVEYSDFECPACAAYFPITERLLAEFPDQLRLIYRHFPLPQHAGAQPAALAAIAANQQGQFWKMATLIFDNQATWAGQPNPAKVFRGYAERLNLDLNRFDQLVADPVSTRRIDSDKAGGLKSKVNATPTFFLNGRKIDNPRSYDDFAALVRAEIEP